ncbi:MAG: hypothetical protein NVSMB65_12480 [Chloroflexota bacterium]
MSPDAARISAVVVAGGRGQRLGRDKALLCLADGTPLLRVVAERLALVAAEVIIAAGSPDRCAYLQSLHRWDAGGRYAVRWQPDDPAGMSRGPLGGLHAGLRAAQGTAVLAVGCDMPYLDPAVLRAMLGRFSHHDIVLPSAGGHLQPLHALYRRDSCLPVVRRHLEAGHLALREVCRAPDLAVAVIGAPLFGVDPARAPWRGVNTPDEMRAAGLRSMGGSPLP